MDKLTLIEYYALRKNLHKTDVSVLIGLTLDYILINKKDNTITFTTTDNRRFEMLHMEDCCETVNIEDVVGDVNDLIGSPIIMAEEISNEIKSHTDDILEKWTFYKLATVKGYVTFRWYGESNGYYSVDADFFERTTNG